MTQTAKLLRELIALPSVNPAFLPAGDPRAGEARVAEFVAVTAARSALDVEFREVAPGRKNVFARLSPSGRADHLVLLAPHTDTVGGDLPGIFTPRRKGGRLYGRGACDTKGSIAAMLTAMRELARSGRRPAKTEILFAGLIDEENAQAGSRALAKSDLQADLAIVGEPTLCQVVTAHKGSLWLQFETRGKAAHGARPELGINAVHRMARIVDLLETDYAKALRRRRHSLLGHPTVSVGRIAGGTQPNIVPDRCFIQVDRRTLPGETGSSVSHEVATFLLRHGLNARIADAKVAPCRPMETNPKLPLVRQLMRCARQDRPLGVDFFCDAAVLSASGIPSVVFGPGDIAQAHTADEWISLRSLERAKDILVSFLSSLP